MKPDSRSLPPDSLTPALHSLTPDLRPLTPGFLTILHSLGRILWSILIDLDLLVYASAIAFNAMISFFPFIVMLLNVCRGLLGWRGGYEAILAFLEQQYLPVGPSFIVRNLRLVVGQWHVEALSMGLLVITSSGIFIPFELALNRSRHLRSRPFWTSHGIGFLLTLVGGVLSLCAVAVAVVVHNGLALILGPWLAAPFVQSTLSILVKGMTAIMGGVGCFLVYYILPTVRQPARQILPIAAVIGVVWELLRLLFVQFLPTVHYQQIYGPFYISAILITWAFLSAILLLIGARLTGELYTSQRLAR